MAYALQTMEPAVLDGVKARVRAKIRSNGDKVVHWGRANAAKGVVPR